MRRKQWSKAVASVTAAAMLVAGCVGNPACLLQVDAQTSTSVMYVDDTRLDEVLGIGMETLTFTRNSVQDPSIVVDGDTYYVFGSHMGVSKTMDLRNWTSVTSESEDSTLFGSVTDGDPISYNQAFRKSAYSGKVTVLVDGQPTEVDFGTYDASSWNTDPDVTDDKGNTFNVQGNMRAPDVIYNGTMNKWCMYLSLNGAKWNSNVILLTADSVEGPYIYQGPVIYSGFNGTNAVDISTTDLRLIYPDIETTGIPEKYQKGDEWGSYWPHAIDPCVSYDENGNLYLIYGSWSGGIYAIELDEATGLRDYTVVYEDVNVGERNVTSDAYFGKKIAGGDYVSGEGAYVEKIGNYWYLFMSYGFYDPTGGYEMRIFRSENIDGPYVDASGESAIFPSYLMNYGNTGEIKAYNGEKLMAGYQWETMTKGELAQGHSSAFTDANGNSYVVYHTKFDDGTFNHELRVHQLYVNEDGWLVAAPYEYTGETVNNSTLATTTVDAGEISGEYQLIVHKYEKDYKNLEIEELQTIHLSAEGDITGAYTGTWVATTGSNVNITLGDTVYNGVFVEQTIDGTPNKTICFTAKSAAGVSIWGSRSLGDEYAVALTRENLGLTDVNNIFPVDGEIYRNVTLPTTGSLGATVTWSSDKEDVLSSEGVVTIPAQDTFVNMYCTVSKGGIAYIANYKVIVMGESSRNGDIEAGLVAFYEFDGDFKDSLSDAVGIAEAQTSGTAPFIKADKTLGSQVASVNFGNDEASSSNYVKLENPLKGNTTGGATISMLVKRGDGDVRDALWGFMDTDNTDGVKGRFYLTGNAYLGFNGTGGWFDANKPDADNIDATTTNAIPVGTWSLVTITTDVTGFDIYIDGVRCYTENHTLAYADSGALAIYESVTNLIASADTFYLGYGSLWGSAPFRADELRFYNRELTAADVSALYDDFQATLASVGSEEREDRTYEEIERYRTYYNDFEEGLGDATIVGNGAVEAVEDESFNKVYHNATANAGVRTNYLLLPNDAISDAAMAGNNELSIGFWVNVADATGYFKAPIFSAYGDVADATTGNTSPMMVLQSRLLAQVNCAGWSDMTAAQNVEGVNQESTAWLDDKEWHYYTATFTEESVIVYVDGEVMNEWILEGNSEGGSVSGLFTNGSLLDYVCLGGNQAWDWTDKDASYMFDDIAVYSTVLSAQEIADIMEAKTAEEVEGPTPVPTEEPTTAPTEEPTTAPTEEPTTTPTEEPTTAPTEEPTTAPTEEPTTAPTEEPTTVPTAAPTVVPTVAPTVEPTVAPTEAPTAEPTVVPTAAPTVEPTVAPTEAPTAVPTTAPIGAPEATATPSGRLNVNIGNEGELPTDVLTDAVRDITGCDSVEELVEYLRTSIREMPQAINRLPNIPRNNIRVVDITVRVSNDGGHTWIPATPEDFAGGVDVLIPYPEGTNSRNYNFIVGHLRTSGEHAGQMEFPEVTKLVDGIKIRITSVSPFVIGWSEIPTASVTPVEPATPVATAAPTAAPEITGGTSPKTYDDSNWTEEQNPADYPTVDVVGGAAEEAAGGNNRLLIFVLVAMGIIGAAVAVYVVTYLKKEDEESGK